MPHSSTCRLVPLAGVAPALTVCCKGVVLLEILRYLRGKDCQHNSEYNNHISVGDAVIFIVCVEVSGGSAFRFPPGKKFLLHGSFALNWESPEGLSLCQLESVTDFEVFSVCGELDCFQVLAEDYELVVVELFGN